MAGVSSAMAPVALIWLSTVSLVAGGTRWPSQQCEICSCREITSAWGKIDRQSKISNCSGLALIHLPANLPDDLDILDISNNTISSVTSKTVQRYHRMVSFIADCNTLTTLPRNTFHNATILQKVSLRGNKLSSVQTGLFTRNLYINEIRWLEVDAIPNNFFRGLLYLTDLSVSTNQNTMSNETFRDLHKMSVLQITAPRLKRIPHDLFVPVRRRLKSLFLDTPRVDSLHEATFERGFMLLQDIQLLGIDSLPPNIFRGVHRLKRLVLRDATALSLDLLANQTGLEQLELVRCNIESLYRTSPLFDHLSNLKSLNLSDNYITHLGSTTFRGLSFLKNLDLSDNLIKTIAPDAFQPLAGTLEHLDLNNNEIDSLETGVFGGLSVEIYLDVSCNSLKLLDKLIFSDLQSLKTLDLHDNFIQNLHPDIFDKMSELTHLNLANNRLLTIPDDLLMDAHSLRYLNLSGNQIEVLPYRLLFDKKLLEKVAIAVSQIQCDCGVAILIYRGLANGENSETTCSWPPEVEGKKIGEVDMKAICDMSTEFGPIRMITEIYSTTVGITALFTSQVPTKSDTDPETLTIEADGNSKPTTGKNPPPPITPPPAPSLATMVMMKTQGKSIFPDRWMEDTTPLKKLVHEFTAKNLLPTDASQTQHSEDPVKENAHTAGNPAPQPSEATDKNQSVKANKLRKEVGFQQANLLEFSGNVVDTLSFQVIMGCCAACVAVGAVGVGLYIKSRRRQRRQYDVDHNEATFGNVIYDQKNN